MAEVVSVLAQGWVVLLLLGVACIIGYALVHGDW